MDLIISRRKFANLHVYLLRGYLYKLNNRIQKKIKHLRTISKDINFKNKSQLLNIMAQDNLILKKVLLEKFFEKNKSFWNKNCMEYLINAPKFTKKSFLKFMKLFYVKNDF